MQYGNMHQLRELVRAYEKVQDAPIGYHTAVLELRRGEEIEKWLYAESRWRRDVNTWLEAEKRFQLMDQRLSDETYAAARRGWDEMKRYVPNLDGVDRFEHLPECLQFRYAAFASAVMRVRSPEEIESRWGWRNNNGCEYWGLR